MISLKNNASNRIAWITGVKGLACYLVFVHHSLLTLLPEGYYGAPRGGLTWLISSTPIGVFVNGNYCVFIFMMLSTFLIAKSVLSSNSDNFRNKAGTVAIKRYFRLMLPILAYGCIRYVLIGLLKPLSIGQYPSLWYVIRHSVYDTLVNSDTSITGPLWMMFLMFRITYLALLLCIPDRKKYSTIIWVYVIAFAYFNRPEERWRYYYITALAGTLLVDLLPLYGRLLARRYTTWIPACMILLGLFLGGVPSAPVPDPAGFYSSLISEYEKYHCYGAFFLLAGLLGEDILLQKSQMRISIVWLLERRPIQFLGQISYSLFLVHEVLIIVFMNPIMNALYAAGLPKILVVSITLLAMSAIVVPISALFHYGVERQTDKLCNKIKL